LVYFSLIRLFFDLFKKNIFDFLVGYQFVNDRVELFLWQGISTSVTVVVFFEFVLISLAISVDIY
jgi:hypothetical protein